MLTLEEQDAAAKAKVSAFVMRPLVLMADSVHGTRAPNPASGTLVRLPSGYVIVLTAGHTLPDEGPVNLHVGDNKVYEDAVEAVTTHPSCDIGLALVRLEYQRELAEVALDFGYIETSPTWKIAAGARLVTAGFPKQFTEDVQLDEQHVQNRFTGLVKYTAKYNHDRQWISLDWREGYRIERGEAVPHKALDVPADKPVYLKKPTGLSGGPVFRVSLATSFAEFSPETHCKLVGVAAEFKDQRELAVPWWLWIDWLKSFSPP